MSGEDEINKRLGNIKSLIKVTPFFDQLNSIAQYVCWISQLKDFAKGQEYSNLAEWELTLWNKQA
jgi:hypothetical protein